MRKKMMEMAFSLPKLQKTYCKRCDLYTDPCQKGFQCSNPEHKRYHKTVWTVIDHPEIPPYDLADYIEYRNRYL